MLIELTPKCRCLLTDLLTEETELGYYQIQKTIRNKSVKVNNIRVNCDMNVFPSDKVCVYVKDRDKDFIEVMYRDDNILVVNKPCGMEVLGEDSLTSRVNDSLDEGTATAVHRLDRNTLGLVVFALTKSAYNDLIESFKDRDIDKTYQTIVVGRPKSNVGTLKNFLFKDAKKSLVYISDVPKEGYMPVELSYKVMRPLGELTLLEVKPITGRTHQIRAQLAHINLPVLGDGKYGINKINVRYKIKTQLLACTKITFHFEKGPLKYLDNKSVVLSIDLTNYYKK